MINTLAIENYRSLLKLIVPLGRLNVITGPNGSGKSNFYRALRLLAETAQGGVVHALAHEGGLESTFWAGPICRLASLLVDRNGSVIKVRSGRSWALASKHINTFDSIFSQVADMNATPEVFQIRETIRGWRFYDHFRTDSDASARLPQLGTRTPVLHHDGRDLAASLQTIREIGDREALEEAVNDAFPGSSLDIIVQQDTRFSIDFHHEGLLRPLSGAELSDGTLRYLLWVAALLTPRPPSLMVLNEPETSLHPDLLPAMARLIIRASENTQIWVITHSDRLISALAECPDCHSIELEKNYGQSQIVDQGLLDEPPWHWPD